MARCMLPVTEMPPRAAFAIFRPRSCAPGATPEAPCARQRVPADGGGPVGGGGDGGEGDATRAREVAQVDDLGRPGAGGDQAVHARVDAGVENRDQDSTPVVRRMLDAELI